MKANPALVHLIDRYLVPQFRKHGQHNTRRFFLDGALTPAYYDPWWWPIDPARTIGDWGLVADDGWILQSLCEASAAGKRFPGFCGSLGARPGGIFVVGERPSFNTSYGAAVTHLYAQIQPLLAAYDSIAPAGEPYTCHITDLVKFRGQNWNDGLTPKMIEISARCLGEELQVLQPSLILITDMAAKRLAAVRNITGWAGLPTATPTLEVPHWKTRAVRQDSWCDRVTRHLGKR
jgi:hypothetical protein